MTRIEKRPYELSLWEDAVSVAENGNISTEEKRLCIIGSDITASPIAAFDILLNRKINGEKTLTFSITSSYWDEEEQEWRVNPYLTKLTNERKVKLKWKGKWHDFIIKNVAEDSKKKVFTYTAKDQHIQDLAKNGYNIQFDKELENNIKTPEEFIEEILKGTDWKVGDCSQFKEYTLESVYEFEVKSNIEGTNIFSEKEKITLKNGKHVFVPYSIIQNKTKRCQFLYSSDFVNGTNPSKDDEGTLVDDCFKNYYFDTASYTNDGYPQELTFIALRNDCRGKHYIRKAKSVYDSKIDKYVNVYRKGTEEKDIYGFVETKYLDQEVARNLISNSENFTAVSGWKPAKIETNGGATSGAPVNLATNPTLEDGLPDNSSTTELLLELPSFIFNSGLYDSRSFLDGLIEGEEYIFEVEYSTINSTDAQISKVLICDYEIKDGAYWPKNVGNDSNPSYSVYFEGELGGKNSIALTCKQKLLKDDVKDSRIGIFLYSNNTPKIKNIAFYKKIVINNEIIKPNTIIFENRELISQKYIYYIPEGEYTLATLDKIYEGIAPNEQYILQYDETYQKKRSLTASKSNRFNLLQTVCETFEGWLDIQVEHDEATGKILSKKIGIKEFIGKENFAGFKYGVNLDAIKRTVDSNQIVTKMIVEPNSNEFAQNGFCTIARSTLNPSGTNVVYNFDYYISQNLLTQEAVWGALNSYNGQLKAKTEEITAKQNEKIAKEKALVESEATFYFQKEQEEAAQKGLLEAYEDLEETTGHNYDWFVQNSTSTGKTEEYNKLIKNTQCKNILTEIIRYKQVIDQYKTEEKTSAWGNELIIETMKTNIAQLEEEIKTLIEQRNKIEEDFYNKFSRFIQEGSWISEEYTDDNLYYLDALATLYTSSRPKVSYNIDVFDLSTIEEYKNYSFNIGDKTFVQDPEFFGWMLKEGIRTPRKEEIVISEMTEGIDNATKNSIKVQNYKTQFEDLFQRIAAATEALQYNTGRYEKFSKAIDTDGSLSHQLLQDAVDKNGLIISGAGHQTVTCDEKGITTIDNANPSSQVRIIGGGVFLTDDGGATWSTGITGDGINADVMTAGVVNTGKVNIVSGGAKTHVWDDKGITSYKTEFDSSTGKIKNVDVSTFVRQDEFGIYGIKNNADFNARKSDDEKTGIEKIERDARYALTWDGFMLKTGEGNERVEIDSEDDIAIYDENNKQRIKIGRVGDDAYGMRITDSTNSDKFAYIGIAPNEVDGKKAIIVAQGDENKRFVVLEDGTMYADGALIDGDVHITDGYLHLMSGDNQVIIDPNNELESGYIFLVTSDKEGKIGLKENGDAEFTGTVKATAGEFTGTIKARGGDIGGWQLVQVSGEGNEDKYYLTSRTPDGKSGILLTPHGYNYTMGEREENFVILAGENFGVTQEGKVYAKDFVMSGGTIDWGTAGVNPPTIEDVPELTHQLFEEGGAVSNASKAASADAEAAKDSAASAATEAGKAATSASNAETSASNAETSASNSAKSAEEAKKAAEDAKAQIDSSAIQVGQATTAAGDAQKAADEAKKRADAAEAEFGASSEEAQKAREEAEKSQAAAGEAKQAAQQAQQKMDSVVKDYLGYGGETTVTPKYVISPYLGGGYLHIVNGQNSVTINPNKITQVDQKIFSIKTNGTEKIGFDNEGNAMFNGVVTATGGQIGGFSLSEGKLNSSANNIYVQPTQADARLVGRYDIGLPVHITPSLSYYDVDNSGKLDSNDAANLAQMANGSKNYDKMASSTAITINPADAQKLITLTATNEANMNKECYFGLSGLKAPYGEVDFIKTGTIDFGFYEGEEYLLQVENRRLTFQGQDVLRNLSCERLYQGTFDVSSEASVSANYSAFVIVGYPSLVGSSVSMCIPAGALSRDQTPYQLTSETSYFSFYLWIENGETLKIKGKGQSSDGYIRFIYGLK